MNRAGRGTAGAVVAGYLRDQVDRLADLGDDVRRDAPDAVHQARTTTRRLRSALATYRPLLDRDATDPTRDELKWFGGVLGAVRDAEVQRDRLVAAARDLPSELVLGPVTERITTEIGRRHRDGRDDLLAALDGPRHADLVAALDELAAHPPLRPRAGRAATQILPALVERSARRVVRAAEALGTSVAPHEGGADDTALEALHELRKAAKRARYAAESASDALGRPAMKVATRMEALQDALGDHQDSVDARATLRQIGVAAHLAGENGFTFGLLFGREEQRSAEALAPLPRLVRRATHRPAAAALA